MNGCFIVGVKCEKGILCTFELAESEVITVENSQLEANYFSSKISKTAVILFSACKCAILLTCSICATLMPSEGN